MKTRLSERLERLEAAYGPHREPLRIVRQIISADEGRPVPFDPQVARGTASGETINRRGGESAEQFESRALREIEDFQLILS